jgi:hypothetical protein
MSEKKESRSSEILVNSKSFGQRKKGFQFIDKKKVGI